MARKYKVTYLDDSNQQFVEVGYFRNTSDDRAMQNAKERGYLAIWRTNGDEYVPDWDKAAQDLAIQKLMIPWERVLHVERAS